MRVPKDMEIDVTLKHDRGAFGAITGAPKGDEAKAGTTPKQNGN